MQEEKKNRGEENDNEWSSLTSFVKYKGGNLWGENVIYHERNRWLKLIRS